MHFFHVSHSSTWGMFSASLCRWRNLCNASRVVSAIPCTLRSRASRTRSASWSLCCFISARDTGKIDRPRVSSSGGRSSWLAGPSLCRRIPPGLLWKHCWSPCCSVLPHLRSRRPAAAVQHHTPVPARYHTPQIYL